jgi:c-di-GMP-binding flagellar brake protein YcgR
MPERRDYERIDLEGNVSFKVIDTPLDIFEAYLDNISFGGFAMYSAQKQKADSLIEFKLTTQALDQPLLGKGKIRYVALPPAYRTQIFTMGVEFVEANKDLVTYLIKRLQLKIANAAKAKQKSNPVDFMPY